MVLWLGTMVVSPDHHQLRDEFFARPRPIILIQRKIRLELNHLTVAADDVDVHIHQACSWIGSDYYYKLSAFADVTLQLCVDEILTNSVAAQATPHDVGRR